MAADFNGLSLLILNNSEQNLCINDNSDMSIQQLTSVFCGSLRFSQWVFPCLNLEIPSVLFLRTRPLCALSLHSSISFCARYPGEGPLNHLSIFYHRPAVRRKRYFGQMRVSGDLGASCSIVLGGTKTKNMATDELKQPCKWMRGRDLF